MGRLVYSVICSLDGYLADASGSFDWAVPSEEVLVAINADMERYSTYLYGRRMYETMAVWETDPSFVDTPGEAAFAKVWQAADKVVFSTTLDSVPTTRTRLLRSFDADEVERIKAAAPGDLTVDGPTLAAHALAQGVVDEVDLILVPVAVGGGLAVMPPGLRTDLELTSTRRFENGMVQVHYRVRR
jgi:dihydrofolate reductase